MCGISGFVLADTRAAAADPAVVIRMRDVLTHRGPDDAGMFVEGRVGLGHRRLSIVDVATGHQPMANEDGRLRIVYNGEIYNHAEQRPWLESRGHVYSTHCDTETILHLFEELGPACVDRLRGMFAFAIWDRRRQELFIARDRLGVKPLYYVHQADGSLFFASEIKALLAADAVKPALRLEALPDYLANHATCDDTTLFDGVHRLLPGHVLAWKDGRIRIERYWDVPGDQDGAAIGLDDAGYVSQWRELFTTSVRLRLMADVPLGMFLSGGIDSSAIAAVMSRLVPDPIKTFSVAFSDREANELPFARLAARAFRTDHHEVLVEPDEFFAALPHLIWHEDEPIGHSASVALYFVSQLAARHVKVVLTGEGSDELLAGYHRYRTTLLNMAAGERYHRATSEATRHRVRALATRLAPGRLQRRLARTFLWRSPGIDDLYFDNFAVFTRPMQRELLTDDVRSSLGGIDPFAGIAAYFDGAPSRDLLDRLLYVDLKTYLHELLMKQDQMSMAASIESRVPFLDHELVAFSARMPRRMKLRGWTTKYVLRAAMRDMVPRDILKRPKMGFPVPVGRWFRESFHHVLDEFVLSPRTLQRGLFRREFVQRLVAEHDAGANHTERLWALVNLEMWQRQFIDGEPLQGALPEIREAA